MAEVTEKTQEERDAEAAELQGRVEQFNKELLPLLGKYELGLGAASFINPNGTVGARPIMFDARKKEAAAEAAPAPAPAAEGAVSEA